MRPFLQRNTHANVYAVNSQATRQAVSSTSGSNAGAVRALRGKPAQPAPSKTQSERLTRFASADHVRSPPDALNYQLSFSVPDFEPEVIALVVIPRSPKGGGVVAGETDSKRRSGLCNNMSLFRGRISPKEEKRLCMNIQIKSISITTHDIRMQKCRVCSRSRTVAQTPAPIHGASVP